jgi:predicted RNA binding protein YcfA (HicA-like mRNA interferase family)
MNNKNKETLKAIFTEPIPAGIRWREIENLIENIGGEIKQSKGSRVRFKLNNIKATFHRPHPEPDTNKLTIKNVREFLENAGIKPE